MRGLGEDWDGLRKGHRPEKGVELEQDHTEVGPEQKDEKALNGKGGSSACEYKGSAEEHA